MSGQPLHQIFLVERVEEAHVQSARLERTNLLQRRFTDAHDNVGFAQ